MSFFLDAKIQRTIDFLKYETFFEFYQNMVKVALYFQKRTEEVWVYDVNFEMSPKMYQSQAKFRANLFKTLILNSLYKSHHDHSIHKKLI